MSHYKTYIGATLPEQDGRHDTSNEVVILVIESAEDQYGVVRYQGSGPLVHYCRDKPELRNKYGCHSPTGFSWGYGGSGPADLALCILIDHGLVEADAWAVHQMFKSNVVAQWPQGHPWQIDSMEIDAWLRHTAHYEPRRRSQQRWTSIEALVVSE